MANNSKPKLPKAVQNPEDALFQAVSLCRKAGKLTLGYDACCDAAFYGKAWLILAASDISPKTLEKLKGKVGDLVEVYTMPLTQERLLPVSRKTTAVYAVTDRGLARLILQKLSDCGIAMIEEDDE